ncbi:MAG TPA: DUF2520 domain-containing protein [Planctomycetota bacterium]|jgi:predicted short-subunit dehydrogenase-like oxidoreductase (DUF2520 family)|nr:DUF2520 domain-containing protein [Planctomycetota bacterium]
MRKRRSPVLRGLRVTVLGRGRAGAAFAAAFAHRGARVRRWSRASKSSAATAAAGADLVLFCVRDDAIALVAEELAAEWPAGAKPPVALHLSGYHGARALRALARKGWPTGSVHPLVPMSGPESAADLEGAWFATSGRGRARTVAQRVISGLGGHELRLADGEERHHAWHLAVALVANGSVALFDAALGLAGDSAAPALASVLQRIARRLEKGPRAALTGPVARGEEEVVAGHLALLRGDDARLYALLARRLLALSDLPPGRRRAMARLLR